jgi:peptidoglycan/LPS O-acetylase OafA/YrhL
MVVLYHLHLGWHGGYVGVDAFFVISGYLITQRIEEDLTRRRFTLAEFWQRRIRRLLPALMVTVLAIAMAGWFILIPDDLFRLGRSLIAQACLAFNVFAVHQIDSGYSAWDADRYPQLHFWSLAVEEQFYLLYPLVLLGARRWLPRSGLAVVLGMLGVLSLGWCLWLTPRDGLAAFYLLPGRGWEFLLGGGLVFLPRLRFPRVIALLGGCLLLRSGLVFTAASPYPGWRALAPCLGTGLILCGAFEGGPLTWGPLRWVGRISYSLYLWHFPLYGFCDYLLGPPSTPVRWGIVGVSLLLASASWHWVETPIRRRLPHPRQAWALLALSEAGLVLTGGWLCLGGGLPQRYPASARAILSTRTDWVYNRDEDDAAAMRGDFPRLGSGALAPSFLLWGDSHAMAVSEALAQSADRHHVTGWKATRNGIPPLLPAETGGYPESRAIAQQVLERVRRDHLACVFVMGYWSADEGDLPHFDASVRQTLAAIRQAGARPVLVLDIPHWRVDPPSYLANRQRYPWLPDLVESMTDFEKSQDRLRRVAGQALILDPTPYLTNPDGTIRYGVPGQLYYRDGDHLSRAGARAVEPMFDAVWSQLSRKSRNTAALAATSLPRVNRQVEACCARRNARPRRPARIGPQARASQVE